MSWQEWVTLVFVALGVALVAWGFWVGTSPPQD